ncbi:MAG: YCF48-related protein [Solirubrobacterales bacterium]
MPRTTSPTLRHFPQIAALTLLIALACAGGASAAIPAGNTGWNWSNPLPQGNSLDRVETSGGRAWVGGATGTLMHSDDGGTTWVAVRTGLLDDIRTIDAVSPTSVVFAGRCALRRSDDGGVTVRRLAWGSSDDSCAAQIQAVSFPSPLIGYMLLSNGDVYSTGDGGDNWKKQGVAPVANGSGGIDPVRDLAFTSVSTGVISVGNRVLHTSDAGVNWTPVKTVTGAGMFNFEFVSGSVGYAVGDHAGMLKTTDGGATWNPVAGDLAPIGQNLRSLSCADESNCVASIASSGSILRTVDGGVSWSAVVVTPQNTVNAVGHIDSTRAVAVGPAGTLASSADGGAVWSYRNSVAEGKFRGIRADSPTSALIFGESGAIARSVNGGGFWNSLSVASSSTLIDATSADPKRIYALDAQAFLHTSANAGKTWTSRKLGSPSAARALFAGKAGRLLIVGPKGLRLSKRYGRSSTAAKGAVARLSLSSVDRAGTSVFAYGPRAIALSKDKGETWKVISRPRRSGSITRLDMLDAKYGYLLDSKAEVFITMNSGRKWTRLETTGANVAASMAFSDRKHGFLTDNTGRVLATADGGATWARQYPYYDATASSVAQIATYGEQAALSLVVGTNHVFATTTGGRIGSASQLTIKPSAKTVRKGTVVRVTGMLTPATGSERVAVLARVVNAKGGTRWVSQERTVSASGTFTTSWRISASTEFIARWSGDASHDGDAAPLKIVTLKK